jgi:hypothetical protein
MVYNAVPNSGQTLGQTRDQIRNNIQALKDSLAHNHVDLDTGADTGNHANVIFKQSPPQLATGAKEIEVFNKDDGAGIPQLWMLPQNMPLPPAGPPNTTTALRQWTSGDITDVNFGAATNGWAFLPGNLLIQYGTVSSVANTGTVTYPIAFAAPAYSVTTSAFHAASTPGSQATYSIKNTVADFLAASFVWKQITNSADYKGFFWIAIGRAA